jgi:large subunit ribosomal protein L3
MKKILTKKIGMTQVQGQEGLMIPVTVLAVTPCQIVQVKTMEKEGYSALQIGTGAVKASRTNKPTAGHFKKVANNYKVLREFKVAKAEDYKQGDYLMINMFVPGDIVAATGISIGKGFQGTIKRWNFSRGLMSHGSKSHRIPGSIGGHTEPGHVFKGKKMAGQMGNKQITVKNLEVVRVDEEKMYILVRGAVPGSDGSIIELKAPGEIKAGPLVEVKPKAKKESKVKDDQVEVVEIIEEAAAEIVEDKKEE